MKEGLHLLRGLIHGFIPDVAPATELVRARRSYVVHKLQHGEHADESTLLRSTTERVLASSAPDWSEQVQPLNELHPDWKAVEVEDEVFTSASKKLFGP